MARVRAAQGKRSMTVVALVASAVLLGFVNMTYYAERLLPVLSPLMAYSSTAKPEINSSQDDHEPYFNDDHEPYFNDKTLSVPDWSTLALQEQEGPAQILVTNYGWNHPDEATGLKFARSIRSTQLLEGVVKHPWFRPVSWSTVSSQPTNITTYVFLDVEMCFEINWPHYGGQEGYAGRKGGLNVDVVNNRSTELARHGPCCSFQDQALKQPIFQSPNVRLVLFDCSGHGTYYCCLSSRNTNKTSVVSISAPSRKHTEYDLGLPPPAGTPVNLTEEQIHDIETCNETSRSLLYTFAGALGRGNVRNRLMPLHNGKDVLVVPSTKKVNMAYDEFLLKSKFAGTPRGDDLFSYRFTEAMSAGAIPVVHADNWVLPFSTKLINWKKCAVLIPEVQVNDTISILSKISDQERCERRKCVLHAYQEYMSTPGRTIDGIIQSLELERNSTELDSQINETLALLNKLEAEKLKLLNKEERTNDEIDVEVPRNVSTESPTAQSNEPPKMESTEAPSAQNETDMEERPIESPLNDKTLSWAPPNYPNTHSSKQLPGQILLTNYGWNHPDQATGLTFARTIRSRQLLDGVLEHPWFRPVSWDTVSSQPTNITTYVFLDVEMCFESNWPHYGGGHKGLNSDVVGNRNTTVNPAGGKCCHHQDQALKQPIFQSPNVRLVLFDCSGYGMHYCCLSARNTNKTSVVSISAPSRKATEYDLGLPPPAGTPVKLTKEQIHDIETCNETSRPLLYTFAGSLARGDVRPKLKPLHNGKDVLVVDNTKQVNMTYDEFLTSSKFTGTPRGDDLFSYRFTEAMSSGAIPVIHADDWILPFTTKLIPWNKCAVRIPEAQVNDTISILSKITEKERCEMHKCVLHVYNRYMRTPQRTIAGIIDSLELMNNKKRRRRRLRGRRASTIDSIFAN